MKKIILDINENIHSQLKSKAKEYGLTMAGYIRQLIIRDIKGER